MSLPFSVAAPTTNIDVVLYVASLVSDVRAVDPILDELRLLTASLPPSRQLRPQQETALDGIYNRLETYLLERDPQRIFTREELHQQITRHFDAVNPYVEERHRSLAGVIAITLAAGALSLLVPQAPTEDSWLEFYSLLVIPMIFTMLHFGAAWFFATALANFRSQLKMAYRLIVIGIILLGVAQAQLVVVGAGDWWNTDWINDGIVTILYLPAFAVLYAGMRRFGQAIGTPVASALIPMIVALVIGVGFSYVVPHTEQTLSSDFFYRLSAAGMAIGAAITGVATITAYRIYKTVTPLYRRPLAWLGAGLAGLTVAALHLLFVHLFVGYDTWYVDYGVVLVPFLVSAIIFVVAGYSFNKVSRQ